MAIMSIDGKTTRTIKQKVFARPAVLVNVNNHLPFCVEKGRSEFQIKVSLSVLCAIIAVFSQQGAKRKLVRTKLQHVPKV